MTVEDILPEKPCNLEQNLPGHTFGCLNLQLLLN